MFTSVNGRSYLLDNCLNCIVHIFSHFSHPFPDVHSLRVHPKHLNGLSLIVVTRDLRQNVLINVSVPNTLVKYPLNSTSHENELYSQVIRVLFHLLICFLLEGSWKMSFIMFVQCSDIVLCEFVSVVYVKQLPLVLFFFLCFFEPEHLNLNLNDE